MGCSESAAPFIGIKQTMLAYITYEQLGNRTGAGNTAVIGKRVQRVRVRGGETVPECTPYPFTAG